MRTVLFALFVVLVVTPVAARQASRLDDPVRGDFRVDSPRADSCAGHTAVDQIARQAHVPVGFEQTSDCGLSRRKRTADPTGMTLTGMSARQALDHLMTLMPDYSWREIDGVAVVRPTVKWEDPTDVLNFPAAAFRVTGGSANDALHQALHAVTPSVFYPHVDDGPSIERPLSFVFPGGTMLDALNAIVRAHQGAEWELGYADNRGTIKLETLVFGGGVVMAPVALPGSPVKGPRATRGG
jgi:hypothetical protein